MPSSFMVKRNYAHCPLKKRPLALYNEPAQTPEQDEPEDLSVKRPRLAAPEPAPAVEARLPYHVAVPDSTTPCRLTAFSPVEPSRYHVPAVIYPEFPRIQHTQYHVPDAPIVPQNYIDSFNNSHVISPAPVKVEPQYTPVSYRPQPQAPTRPKSQENLPSLAEYYLQLFKATSESENRKPEVLPSSGVWQSSYLPPSPQTSPNSNSFVPPRPQQFYPSPMPLYPESSALISPVSTCSSVGSDSEEELQQAQPHPRGTRYSCDACGKSYSTQSGLRKHSELHCASLGPRAFACKHCSKAYTSIGALKMHIRTHTLPCKCHVCGKAFSRPWLLQGHIRTHTGEKPFECQQCNRSFADRSNLRAHQQTHERVKKYACQTCKKTFSRMSLLNKHAENACSVHKFTTSPLQSMSPVPVIQQL